MGMVCIHLLNNYNLKIKNETKNAKLDLGIINGAILFIIDEFKLDYKYEGVIIAMFSVGGIIGSFTSSFICNFYYNIIIEYYYYYLLLLLIYSIIYLIIMILLKIFISVILFLLLFSLFNLFFYF